MRFPQKPTRPQALRRTCQAIDQRSRQARTSRGGPGPMSLPGSTVEVAGRRYDCYCQVPVPELNALPEAERRRAERHILQHQSGSRS